MMGKKGKAGDGGRFAMDFLELLKIVALVAAVLVRATFLDEYLDGLMKKRREEKKSRKE